MAAQSLTTDFAWQVAAATDKENNHHTKMSTEANDNKHFLFTSESVGEGHPGN